MASFSKEDGTSCWYFSREMADSFYVSTRIVEYGDCVWVLQIALFTLALQWLSNLRFPYTLVDMVAMDTALYLRRFHAECAPRVKPSHAWTITPILAHACAWHERLFAKIKFTNLKYTLFWASTAKFFHRQYFVIYGIIVISGNSYPVSKIFICCNSFSSSAPSSVRGEGRSLLVCLVWICIALHLEVLNDM